MGYVHKMWIGDGYGIVPNSYYGIILMIIFSLYGWDVWKNIFIFLLFVYFIFLNYKLWFLKCVFLRGEITIYWILCVFYQGTARLEKKLMKL